MASTYTPLGLTKQAVGENVNTWGTILNDETVALIDEAIRARAAFALTGTVTLTSTSAVSNQARCMLLHATSGTGGTVVIPTISKLYIVWNQSTGNMVVSTGGATTATLETGDLTVIFTDGDKVRQIMIGGLSVKEYVAAAMLGVPGTLPAQAGNAGRFVKTDGTNATWQFPATTDLSDYNTNVKGLAVALAVAL